MPEILESKSIHFVKFSHWKYGAKEEKIEMYLYSDEYTDIKKVNDWIYNNFTNEETNEHPIVWEIKFVSFSFSLDHPISDQDY